MHQPLASCLVFDLHRRQEVVVCRGNQGLLWPWQEPVDRSAVYQRRERTQSTTEVLTHWRHADYHVQVLLAQRHEELILLVDRPRRFYCRDVLDYTGFLLRREQIGYLPIVEYVAYLLDHALPGDLGIGEQKHSGFLLEACGLHELLDLLDPVLAVNLGVLILEGNVGAEHGQTLPTATADTH
jgi:hypothetical protein